MRVRLLTVPFALAIVAACVGSENFTGPGGGPGIGGPAGDAGPITDAGDAGDGGTITDAGGCLIPTGPLAVPVETCGVGGTGLTATFIPAGCLDVTIAVSPDGESCHGTLTGPTNAFSGTCTNTVGTCTANHLPGIINCTLSSTAQCAIQICADQAGNNCPP